jgi:hypothetical protein
MTDDDTLYKLQLGNVAASIIHGGLAVWAGRKLYKNPDGFGKIEKYFNQHIRQCPPPVEGGIKVTFEEDGRINMLGLLTSFYIITSLAHAFYAFSGPLYYNNAISSGNNWMRWIEYGITSSLMVVIVARFAGISDRSALYTIGSANSAVMFMGQITEMSLQKGDTKTAWTATLVGWWITMWIWGSCIIPKFRQSISELRKANIPIPEFVQWVIWAQFAFFMSFGVVQLSQLISVKGSTDEERKQSYLANYPKYESAYIVLSLVAKTTLGSSMIYGLTKGGVYKTASNQADAC